MIRDFGINKKLNVKVYHKYGLNIKNTQLVLNVKQKEQFQNILKKGLFGKLLKESVKNKIDFSIKNKTFRGMRHKQKYPVRGQRTHTNAKTRKRVNP